MAEANERPLVDFNHESAHHRESYESEYKDLRNRCPMGWTKEHGGYWVATKYEDILKITRDPETFSSAKEFDPATGALSGGLAIPPVPNPRSIPIEVDPPEWQGYRRLINPKLGPGAIEAMRPFAEKYSAALMDRFIEKGECDLVRDFTNPLPALVTMNFFGLPLDEYERFSDPLHEVYSVPRDTQQFLDAVAGLEWMRGRLYEEIEARRKTSKKDFIGYLVDSQVDGKHLDDEIIQEICFNVMAGGVDTTTALTSNVLIHLDQNRDDLKLLADNPEKLPIACEEFVRYFSPIHGFARNVRKEVEVAGQHMMPGDRVFLAYSSANRDEDIFECPDKVDVERFPNRHMGFGAGIHRCVGSFFARVMFESMMRQVLTRIPDYTIDHDACVRYPSIAAINGVASIPARFTPGAKIGTGAIE